jgi:isoleucyl-tRNA synthetase
LIREEVNKALEEAKSNGVVEKPLVARVTLAAPPDLHAQLAPYRDQLAGIFLVSQAELTNGAGALSVQVSRAEGDRCDRCWLVLPTVGQDAAQPSLCHRCVAAVGEAAPSA